MNAPGVADWSRINQQTLAAAVAALRTRVEAARTGDAPPAPPDPPPHSALARLCDVFELTQFERDILLLAAAPELDSGFPAVPTFGLALAALAEPHWSALLPQAPLRWWRLVTLAPDAPLCEARLRIEEPALHALAGLSCFDERLASTVSAVSAPDLPPSQSAVAREAAEAIGRGRTPLLIGPYTETQAVAAAAASTVGLSLYAATEAALAAPGAASAHGWLRLWQRDAALGPAALLVRLEAHEHGAGAAENALKAMRTPYLLTSDRSLETTLADVRFAVARPSRDEQADLWRAALDPGSDPAALEAETERVVTHFDLGAGAIAAAARAVEGDPRRVWAQCRSQTARPSEHAAARETRTQWRDLALPERSLAHLRAIVGQVRGRRTVHDRWGFGARAQGLGVTALFYGPSGTGKSLAAEAIAHELDVALHVIDLSRVVSKYIGETERNLRAAFEAAESGGAALLFDEADALFGARSEVRDSHDRYANIEVSYLLQRMEQHRGLAILTTNMKDSIDTAFLRRVRFVVEFAHPGPAERRELWRSAFPEAAPLEGVDPVRLAQANLTGAQIYNIALSAAFIAAETGGPIRMVHCLEAAERECAKLQRPLTQAETEGWL